MANYLISFPSAAMVLPDGRFLALGLTGFFDARFSTLCLASKISERYSMVPGGWAWHLAQWKHYRSFSPF